jgi:alginate O-acetyltransferase complex protein AlgI
VESDLAAKAALPLVTALVEAVAPEGLALEARSQTAGLATLVLLWLLVWMLAAAVARAEGWLERPGSRRLARRAVLAAALLAAAGLSGWIYLHPAQEPVFVAARFDHVVFALLAGLCLRRAPLQARLWALNALSLLVLEQCVGWRALAGILAACLLGFGATRWSATRRPLPAVLVHGGLLLGVLSWLLVMRGYRMTSWAALSLFLFLGLRYLSFAVEASRGATSGVAGYLCFLLFYPTCIGAVEVFREFGAQNLRERATVDFRASALAVAKGSALVTVAFYVSVDQERMTGSAGFAAMWTNLLLLYLKAACFSMGVWTMAEASASFLGVRLRPNFRDVLAARNPSQFWRAWRGTMANWLIQYVYVPLGGGRRHRTLNIAAVFAVSTAWHGLGILNKPAGVELREFLPILLWGFLNFAGVAGHAWLRRVRPPRGYAGPAALAIGAPKWALTAVFGSLTVALLGFSPRGIERFEHVALTLVGLGGW